MRGFAIALLFDLAVFAQQSQPPSPAPNKQSNTKQSSEKHGKTSREDQSNPATTIIGEQENAKEGDTKQGRSSSDDHIVAIATIVIAFATIAQALIYWKQTGHMRDALAETKKAAKASADTLIVIREQTDLTRITASASADNAAAAKATAQTMINSERAWLVLSVLRQLPPEVGNCNILEFRFVNHGRTPAWITDLRFTYAMTPEFSLEKMTYTYGMNSPGPFAHGTVVGPGEYTDKYIAQLGGYGLLTKDELNRIMLAEMSAHFYGLVRYKDISESQRETAFCFTYQRDEHITNVRWKRSGPDGANRHT